MLDLLKNETFIITVLGIICLMIIITNRLSSKKEKELDDKVQNNVTSIGEISPEDIPNTELTEKELREIDINPLTLRDFIFRFSECIANDCMDYMKEEDDYWPEHLRIEAKKQIRSNIIAETAVALFILTYEIFRNDMISSERNTVYSYISGFWNHSYNDRIIDGPWKYGTYKDLIKIRLTAYSRILGYHSVRIDLGSFLSAYIDYHCQTILSLLLTQEATPYTPSQVESGASISSDGSRKKLYQVVDFSSYRIDGSTIEQSLKNILFHRYADYLGINKGEIASDWHSIKRSNHE